MSIANNSIFTTGPSAPPTNVNGIATDSRTLTIIWLPPTLEARNGIIVEYEIEIVGQVSGDRISYTTSGNSSSFLIEGLHPDYFYTYRMSAATSVGSGPQSEIINIRMPEDGKTNSSYLIQLLIFIVSFYSACWWPN